MRRMLLCLQAMNSLPFQTLTFIFFWTALDQGKLLLEHSKLFTINMTRSYSQFSCLCHTDTKWPISVLLTDTSIHSDFRALLRTMTYKLHRFMLHPDEEMFMLCCHGHQRFHSPEHSGFLADAVQDVPLTTASLFMSHINGTFYVPFKQGDHTINFSPTHWLVFWKPTQLGRKQTDLSSVTHK